MKRAVFVILLSAVVSAYAAGARGTDSPSVAEPSVVEPAAEPAVTPETPIATAAPEAPAGAIIGTIHEPLVAYACDSVARPWQWPVAAHPITTSLLSAAPIGALGQPLPASIDGALAEAAAVPLDELSTRDRILIQAVALRAASAGDERRAAVAATVARRVALDPTTLRALGSDPRVELEPWIGSAEGWVERRGPACGAVGTHDRAYGGALAFRTIRSGALRVLFAQIVALDSELSPHVTPVVGLVEMRTGMLADSSACVLEAEGGRLDALAFDALHASPFIRVAPGAKVGCGGCHTGGGSADLVDLGREAGGAFRVERRIALLELARERRKLLSIAPPRH